MSVENWCDSIPDEPSGLAETAQPVEETFDIGSEETKEDDHFCNTCNVSLNSPFVAQQHYMGKKHRKQIRRKELTKTHASEPGSERNRFPCQLCRKRMNSMRQYEAHINGSHHKSQLKKSKSKENQSTADNMDTTNDDPMSEIVDTPNDNQHAATCSD